MKLADIDKLRGRAAELALASHPEGPATGNYAELRKELLLQEKEIELRLRFYWAQPDCPFCRHRFGWAIAKLETSGTAGRLQCERCGAQALVGRCEVRKRWDE